MKYRLTGSVSLSKNTKPRSTRAELLRVDEETGKPYKDYGNHIDSERTPWNQILVNRNVRDVYAEHVGPAIERYNARMLAGKSPHSERCKTVDSYMAEIEAGERAKNARKRPRLWNDLIIQCGDMLTNEVWQVNGSEKFMPELARITNEVYKDFVREFQERFPNLVIILSGTHNDESTCHNMIQYVAFCHNNRRGLDVQVKACDAWAEALDRLGVPYNRKQDDGVKHAFNKVLDDMLTEIMARHGIERVPGEKKESKGLTEPVAELRKRDRLLREQVQAIVDKGEGLDTLKDMRLPGGFYREKDVMALFNSMMKERAILLARAETAEEIGRRNNDVLNEKKKHMDITLARREKASEADIAKREDYIRQKELDVYRAVQSAQAYESNLRNKDQQHRYEVMADELTQKKVEIDEAYNSRINMYFKAEKDAEKTKAQAHEEAKRIVAKAQAEADCIVREAEVTTLKHKAKLSLLAERYPDINEMLEKEVKKRQKRRIIQKNKCKSINISQAEKGSSN